jgi:hypothetical protein
MGIEQGMPNFQGNKPKTEKETEYKFQHNFIDGTVGRYKTKEELSEALEGEIENAK